MEEHQLFNVFRRVSRDKLKNMICHGKLKTHVTKHERFVETLWMQSIFCWPMLVLSLAVDFAPQGMGRHHVTRGDPLVIRGEDWASQGKGAENFDPGSFKMRSLEPCMTREL